VSALAEASAPLGLGSETRNVLRSRSLIGARARPAVYRRAPLRCRLCARVEMSEALQGGPGRNAGGTGRLGEYDFARDSIQDWYIRHAARAPMRDVTHWDKRPKL